MFKKFAYVGAALVACGFVGCASTQGSGGEAEAVSSDASSQTVDGFSVKRPNGWTFVAVDETVAADTVIVLQGPFADGVEVAPALEVSKRPLGAADRRRNPTFILTDLMTEFMQTVEGFQIVGEPADTELGGMSAGMITFTFEQMLTGGSTVARKGKFYAVVHQGSVWLVRCTGPVEDSDIDSTFDTIVQSISIES